MSGKLWKQAWADHQIDFHQGQPNALLQAYWPALALAPGAQVFVPLCGKSLDMIWLRGQGHAILGVEVSPIAVADFFAENGLQPRTERIGRMTRWYCEGIEIYCGDFFDLGRLALGAVAGVYDRAALLAFSPAMRKRYVRRLAHLLPARTAALLLTSAYPEADEVADARAVDPEIAALYQAAFSIALLHTEAGWETHPGHGHAVTERIEEKVYLLRTRQG